MTSRSLVSNALKVQIPHLPEISKIPRAKPTVFKSHTCIWVDHPIGDLVKIFWINMAIELHAAIPMMDRLRGRAIPIG